jgi:hypothetical protein
MSSALGRKLSEFQKPSKVMMPKVWGHIMQTIPMNWRKDSGWQASADGAFKADLVLYFGGRETLADAARHHELKAMHPDAILLGCSTGGQIDGDDIDDAGLSGLAVSFSKTRIAIARSAGCEGRSCHAAGKQLANELAARATMDEPLAGIFVLSDGLLVNGSQLVRGMMDAVGRDLPIMGGLAGDGADFTQTLVAADAAPHPGVIAALGLYGHAIRIGHGSAGGWDVFGPRRRVTRSEGNVLLELDGEPALDLYKRYLGEEAAGLPGTGLLFPLLVCDPDRPDHEVVRTILAVDHEARSLTFAGDVPQGWSAQLMRGNFDRLSEGAAEAARAARTPLVTGSDSLAVMISCIGRRLLMGQRITEELEAALGELPHGIPTVGFYSYGEISPHTASGFCELHNQTMTVMTLSEAA